MALLLSPGCTARPNQANIELRKQVQALESRVAEMDRVHQADQASLRASESGGETARPSLSSVELEKLVTVHGIRLGRLTGGMDSDRDHVGDEGIKVYVVPVDQSGDKIKSAGSFTIELFDLNLEANNRIGRWQLDLEQSRQRWFGSGLLYEYVLECPWQQIPQHESLTLKVTFCDELTHREFSVEQIVKITLPTQAK